MGGSDTRLFPIAVTTSTITCGVVGVTDGAGVTVTGGTVTGGTVTGSTVAGCTGAALGCPGIV